MWPELPRSPPPPGIIIWQLCDVTRGDQRRCVPSPASPAQPSPAQPSPASVRSSLFKNWTPGEYFFFNFVLLNKRATNWKAVESCLSESLTTFYSCWRPRHSSRWRRGCRGEAICCATPCGWSGRSAVVHYTALCTSHCTMGLITAPSDAPTAGTLHCTAGAGALTQTLQLSVSVSLIQF